MVRTIEGQPVPQYPAAAGCPSSTFVGSWLVRVTFTPPTGAACGIEMVSGTCRFEPMEAELTVMTPPPASIIVSETVTVATCDVAPESLTLKVRDVASTAASGMPLISPVEEFRLRPAGSWPSVRLHE
jgi:hypothetical protein